MLVLLNANFLFPKLVFKKTLFPLFQCTFTERLRFTEYDTKQASFVSYTTFFLPNYKGEQMKGSSRQRVISLVPTGRWVSAGEERKGDRLFRGQSVIRVLIEVQWARRPPHLRPGPL